MTAELLYINDEGTLGFGDYTLAKKEKVEDFEFQGDLYKVKSYVEMTKLEKNGMFVYESVRGTTVQAFNMADEGIVCQISGQEDVQITFGLEPKHEYQVIIAGTDMGVMGTNMGGKLSISVSLIEGTPVMLEVVKL